MAWEGDGRFVGFTNRELAVMADALEMMSKETDRAIAAAEEFTPSNPISLFARAVMSWRSDAIAIAMLRAEVSKERDKRNKWQ